MRASTEQMPTMMEIAMVTGEKVLIGWTEGKTPFIDTSVYQIR